MTRRMIDTGMWTNEHFGEMPMMARLLLLGIINHADDQGRTKAHLVFLRSQIFPYDDVTTEQIDECLALIEANGTIELYEASGKRYIQLCNWWEYQTLNFAIPSDYPAPEGWRDRLRFNGKGGIMYTHNWHKVDGSSTPDNCDHLGIPLPTQPGKVKPPTEKTPPTNNGTSHVPAQVSTYVPSHVDTLVARQDKDYKEDHDQKEDQVEAEGLAPPAAVATNANIARLWAKWDANMPGVKTQVIVDGVNELLNEYSIAEIEEAINIACKRNKRFLSYIEGILAKGVFSDRPQPSGGDYRSNHGTHRRYNAAGSGQTDRGDTPDIDPAIQQRMDEHRAKRKAEGSAYYNWH